MSAGVNKMTMPMDIMADLLVIRRKRAELAAATGEQMDLLEDLTVTDIAVSGGHYQ